MKWYSLLFLLLSDYASCRIINNVRLVDHTSYMINVITQTMHNVEKMGWCNLKLPDYTLQINENILLAPFRGSVRYTNGFVSSIQHVDIIQSTVQQNWRYNASAESTHTATVSGTMRLHDVAVGFDVIGHLQGDNKEYHYTAVYVHPLITYAFTIIRDVFTEALSVTVVGTVPRTVRTAEFRPKDNTSDIFLQTFDSFNVSASGMLAWANDVFQPITLNVVKKEIPFPSICYNCAT
ncbi:hypothetical protein PYW07_007687 [Mythimna separata]|uniref:Uncharacterized protein n=1 Tax=Mythimna separata TaxID=271217 RepID=A0AAD8DU77_MYTSE|nr:hypothetical protein PYW07_007687 [Mythimna separata]